MEKNVLSDVPAGFLMQLDLFAKAVYAFVPEPKITGETTIGDLVEQATDREGLLKALSEADQAFREAMRKEVLEFGVDLDPQGLRYQWGDPETNEKVVSLIEAEESPIEEGRIVFYGPSNICFWYSLEQDMLPYKAYNHGIGGCIDDDMMFYAPRLLYPYKPKVVFFQTGSNDIASGIPLETILANKKKMNDMFLENMPEAKLVVCSGLPLPGRTQFWDATVETNRLLQKMCEETDRLYFLDATNAMLTDQGPDKLKTSDGRYFNPAYYRMDKIHLNKAGHDVWTGLMKDMLKKIL